MQLNERSRDYYDVSVTTDPAVTNLEASFDDGLTWHAGEVVADPTPDTVRRRWLVAGPEAEPGTQVAQLPYSLTPRGRVSNTAVTVVFEMPGIEIT